MILNEIDKRKSFRALSDKPIDKKVLKRILTAATYAPSHKNSQPWRFLVLAEEENLNKAKSSLKEGNYWARKSPLIIAVLIENSPNDDDEKTRRIFDLGLASMNILLQAQKEGLYSHMVGGFRKGELKEALEIDEGYILQNLIILSHPGESDYLEERHQALEVAPRDRKPLEEVVSYNRI